MGVYCLGLHRFFNILRFLQRVFSTLLAKLLHLLKRFFAVLRGLARRVTNRAAKVSDDKFSFGHRLTKMSTIKLPLFY